MLFFGQLEELKPHIDLLDVVVLLVLRARERGADRTHYFLYRTYQIIGDERSDTDTDDGDLERLPQLSEVAVRQDIAAEYIGYH